jgi:hypothetical protein
VATLTILFTATPVFADFHELTVEAATAMLNEPIVRLLSKGPAGQIIGVRFPIGKVRVTKPATPGKFSINYFPNRKDGLDGEVDDYFIGQLNVMVTMGLIELSNQADDLIVVTPTVAGRNFIDVHQNNVIFIPEFDNKVKHVVRVENRHIGVSDYAIIKSYDEETFNNIYVAFYKGAFGRDPKAAKWVTLYKYDDFAALWEPIVSDSTLVDKEFSTNNVDLKLREIQGAQ